MKPKNTIFLLIVECEERDGVGVPKFDVTEENCNSENFDNLKKKYSVN